MTYGPIYRRREVYRAFVETSDPFVPELIETLVGTDDDLEIGLREIGVDLDDDDLPFVRRRLRDLGVYQDPDDGFWYRDEEA
jgi:hypothetical protein